jgi:hypothetical protein
MSVPKSTPRRGAAAARLAVELLEDRSLLSGFQHLDPGGPPDLRETVPVNIVFVGYEPTQIDTAGFRAALPERYDPVARYPRYYGADEDLGLHYRFQYDLTFAGPAWENAFFGELGRLAMPRGRLSDAQQAYNAQVNNRLDVTTSYTIDAPAVERWLAGHAPAGVDTRENTIFFINWYGRSDFLFHAYVKRGEPVPDNGFDVGSLDDRDLIAWGGTTPDDEETGLGALGERRVWFHDLSAGPDFWTGSWNVDIADLDGDGQADYRLPPVWEYAAGGYRSPAALTGDLALVTRYVGINLLFTPSPVFDPAITPDRLPDRIDIDVNTFEGIPGFDASATLFQPDYVLDEVQELLRLPMTIDTQDLEYGGVSQRSLEGWADTFFGDPNAEVTYTDLGNQSGYSNLFYDAVANLPAYLDDTGIRGGQYTYEAVMLNYAIQTPTAVFGLADENWWNGTQGFLHVVLNAQQIFDFGITMTGVAIHELGHHFGLSHPHDGYDSERGIDYVPTGPLFFAWTGNNVNSVMGYMFHNFDFGQFDRDNMNRYQTSAYVRSANAIAEDVLASGPPLAARVALHLADFLVGRAEAALAGHDYARGRDCAKLGYETVLLAARLSGVEVLPSDDGRTLPPVSGGGGGEGGGGGRRFACGCAMCRGFSSFRDGFGVTPGLTAPVAPTEPVGTAKVPTEAGPTPTVGPAVWFAAPADGPVTGIRPAGEVPRKAGEVWVRRASDPPADQPRSGPAGLDDELPVLFPLVAGGGEWSDPLPADSMVVG